MECAVAPIFLFPVTQGIARKKTSKESGRSPAAV